MKIAYIDINEADCIEDYSTRPNRYGGGRVIAAALLNRLDNFHIFAHEKSFSSVPDEKINKCHPITDEQRKALANGSRLSEIVPSAKDFDIYFHHFSNSYLNLDGCNSQKQVVWPVGWREVLHPSHKYVMYFDLENQQPFILSNPRIFDITIGPRFPVFEEYEKEDMIFQCSRHFKAYSSIKVASLANKYNIKTVFAGPIEGGYPLRDYIDGKNSFYLGIISQDEKESYLKRAKFVTQFQDYGISVTLAGKEAASFGCGILATEVGAWKNFIKNSQNGFLIRSEEEFVEAWECRSVIKQKTCYDLALPFSEEQMVSKVMEAIGIINDLP